MINDAWSGKGDHMHEVGCFAANMSVEINHNFLQIDYHLVEDVSLSVPQQ